MKKQQILLITGLIFCLSLGGLIFSQQSGGEKGILKARMAKAVLQLNTPKEAIINEPFEVKVQMDSGRNQVNAVGVYLSFDPSKLQLLQLDSQASFCQFYPEKKFDNQLGRVNLACGSPHPGVAGENHLLLLSFLPVSLGETSIRVRPESKILRSDGKGMDILRDYPQADLMIVNGL